MSAPQEHRLLPLVASASLVAALVHASIVEPHLEHAVLAWMFGAAAVLQGVWALVVVQRPSRALLAAGAVGNLAIAGMWAATRAVGVSFVDGLVDPQPVEVKGIVATACAVGAAGGALWTLSRGRAASARWGFSGVAAAVLLVVISVPVLTTGHTHDHAEAPGGGVIAAAAADDHDHGENAEPTEDLPEGVTAEQQAFADRIIAETKASLPKWADAAAAEADGFRTIGDGITGFEHFVHREWYLNPNVLDPTEPESLVYRVDPDGSRELVSAMYLLPPGSTTDDVPPVMDSPLSPWHIHDNLCWNEEGRVVAVSQDKVTCPRGVLRVTPPMVHVWIVDHPCGPFAGLEGHGEGCEHEH